MGGTQGKTDECNKEGDRNTLRRGRRVDLLLSGKIDAVYALTLRPPLLSLSVF